jgi:hypothetical protein
LDRGAGGRSAWSLCFVAPIVKRWHRLAAAIFAQELGLAALENEMLELVFLVGTCEDLLQLASARHEALM